jgi:hypothetical protein
MVAPRRWEAPEHRKGRRIPCDAVSERTTHDADLEQRLSRAEAALAESLEERGRLWEQLQAARAGQADEEHFYRRYRALEASLSWKLTKPLRSAKTLALGLKKARDRGDLSI